MKPTVPPEPAPPTRPQDGKQCGACSRGDHADCSGWCFCPKGPCDEVPAAARPAVATTREDDAPGSAREAVHKAFRLTVSRGGVAPFCYFKTPPGPCGELCNLLTDAIERDRASRSPGPTSALVDCGWCGTEGIGDDHRCQGVLQYGLKFVEHRPLSGLDAATVEAAIASAREEACADSCLHERCLGIRIAVAKVRALATPPGQAKP